MREDFHQSSRKNILLAIQINIIPPEDQDAIELKQLITPVGEKATEQRE